MPSSAFQRPPGATLFPYTTLFRSNAFVLTTPERALESAKESDTRIGKGEARPLEGIPLGIKDLFATKGVRTTACSHILDGFTPTYEDRKSTRLNSSHTVISYAVFCFPATTWRYTLSLHDALPI